VPARINDSQATHVTDAALQFSPSQPTHLGNQPLNQGNEASKRPVNTYQGKDPIKKRVQNKRLQALLADKPIPKEAKPPKEGRMVVRMGVHGDVTLVN
jgi:hypothetical protein